MASGDSLLSFIPTTNEPPASNPATPDLRNQHPVLDFDDTTQETAIFSAVMPQHYAAGGVTVRIGYSMSSATTGAIVLEAALERIGDQQQDVDSDGFAAANASASTTVPGTSGNVDVVSITFTDGADMDSVAAGELFRLKIERDADGTNGTDDATGDLELHFVEIQET